MNEINGYYCLSVHPTRINYYYSPFVRKSKTSQHGQISMEDDPDFQGENPCISDDIAVRPKQFADNYHHGKISTIAESKINRALDYLVYLAQDQKRVHTLHGKTLAYRLVFVTLTLSSEQIHSDHEIYNRIFRPFLMALNRKWKVGNYFWRAEKQATGNIHYHLVTDRFIPWNELRNVWNRCQQNLGYVTRYRENQIFFHRDGFRFRKELAPHWSRDRQLKAYKEGIRTDWENPNSTDIHSLKLISDVRAYFKKYMTKSGQSSDVAGRLWGCSLMLSRITGAQAAIYSRIDDDLSKIQRDKSVKVFQSDFYTIIYITILQLTALGCTEILEVWYSYMAEKFHFYEPPGFI